MGLNVHRNTATSHIEGLVDKDGNTPIAPVGNTAGESSKQPNPTECSGPSVSLLSLLI